MVPGLWGFNLQKDLVESSGITFEVYGGAVNPIGSRRLGWRDDGTYMGDRPVNFAPTKTLHIEQVNTTYTVLDGAHSTLPGVVGVGCHSFCKIETVVVPHPEFKCFRCGTVDELKVLYWTAGP